MANYYYKNNAGDGDWGNLENWHVYNQNSPVSLLLNFDGNFNDSSVNNLIVTPNGNATISTSQIRFGSASLGISGSGSFISVANSPVLDFGSKDFTIEFWAYMNAQSGWILGKGDEASATGSSFSFYNEGNWQFYYDGNNYINLTPPQFSIGKWQHIAIVREGSTVSLYLDGVVISTANIGSGTINSTTKDLQIGGYAGGSIDGYIDDLRITKGIALYTNTFIPPSTPLSIDANPAPLAAQASLLLHFDNNFNDSSNNNFQVVYGGGVTTISNSTSRWGAGSAYFDGNSHLVLGSATGSQLHGEGGDFTIECWVNPDMFLTTSTTIFGTRPNSNFADDCLIIALDDNGSPFVHTNSTALLEGSPITAQQWTHLALTKQGNTFKLYIDGVLSDQITTASFNLNSSEPALLGWEPRGERGKFLGYIDDFRIIKGLAVYTGNFIPPSGPLATYAKPEPVAAQASLLLHFDNNFFDSSVNNLTMSITSSGNVITSTAQSKFGGSSAYFDGTSAHLSVTMPIDWDADWTLEFWYHRVSQGSGMVNTIFGAGPLSFEGHPGGIHLYDAGGGQLSLDDGIQSGISDVNIPTGRWTHIAVVRHGGVNALYVDGESMGTSTMTFGDADNSIVIGGISSAGFFCNAYIDDLRITKGVAVYTRNFIPPIAPLTTIAEQDAFPHIPASLLLRFDGANNSTNFKDSSVNALTVAASGNAKISTAQSKFGGSSGLFDGSNAQLTIPHSSDLDFGTGDFTVEAWVFLNSNTSSTFFATGSNNGWFFGQSGGEYPPGGVGFGRKGLAWDVIDQSAGRLPTGQWIHLSVTRSGSKLRTFVNGEQTAEATTSASFDVDGGTLYIGSHGDFMYFDGYIDDLRIIKGHAVYTENFTPPTAPVDPVVRPEGTPASVLLHFDGADGSTNFIDLGSNLVTVIEGYPIISTGLYRFGGASGYFGGGSSLSVSVSEKCDMKTGDFTVECWAHLDSNSPNPLFNIVGPADAGWPNDGMCFFRVWGEGVGYDLDGKLALGNPTYDAFEPRHISSLRVPKDQWVHLAASRQNGTVRLFIDGVLEHEYSGDTTNYNFGLSGYMAVGNTGWDGPGGFFTGHIDDLRIVKGLAVYTGNFIPPTAPLSLYAQPVEPAAQASLLLHFEGVNGSTTFTDSSNNPLTVTAYGSAVISTAQSKWGGSSLNLDGNSYVYLPSNSFSFGGHDFTIECWVYVQDITGYTIAGQWGGSNNAWFFALNSIYINSALIASYPKPSPNEWHHMAACRQNNTLRVFIDGAQVASAELVGSINLSDAFIGIGADQLGNAKFVGYIDEFRIINGLAVYTGNFIPRGPLSSIVTEPEPIVNSASLLLNFNGPNNSTTFTDSSLNALTVTPNGNAVIKTSKSKFGGSSAYFDGSSSISLSNSPGFVYGTDDFTIEFWFYANSVSGVQILYGHCATGNNYCVVAIENESVKFIFDYNNPGTYVNGPSVSDKRWHHVAVCRKNGFATVYVDGIGGTPVACSFNFDNYSYSKSIGSYPDGMNYGFVGYIEDFRIFKGLSVYTNNFIPPTSPLTAILEPVASSQTSLLLHFDGNNNSTYFKDSSLNAITLKANGNAAISTAQSKFGGASAYFSSADAGLSILDTSVIAFETANFTIEFWLFLNDATGTQFFFLSPTPNQIGLYVSNGDLRLTRAGIDDPISGSFNFVTGQWYHIAISRQNGVLRLFIDGVLFGDATVTDDFVGGELSIGNGVVSFGADQLRTKGYIDEFRITKGKAIYTNNFTPPTQPFSIETPPVFYPSSLLLNFDGNEGSTTFTDSSINSLVVSANGSAKLSTAQSKFGGSSGYFDGNGYLSIPQGDWSDFQGKDYTIEFWYRPLAGPSGGVINFGWQDFVNTSPFLLYADSSANSLDLYSTRTNWSNNRLINNMIPDQWYHVAVCGTPTGMKGFLDGVIVFDVGASDWISNSNLFTICSDSNGSAKTQAYIDDLRIIKGKALYDSNFTPPQNSFFENLVPAKTLPTNFDNVVVTDQCNVNSSSYDLEVNSLSLIDPGSWDLTASINNSLIIDEKYSSSNVTDSLLNLFDVYGRVYLNSYEAAEFNLNNSDWDFDITNWVFYNSNPSWTFTNAVNLGICGNAIFNMDSYNAGRVLGDATFNNNSSNYNPNNLQQLGIVEGVITCNTTADYCPYPPITLYFNAAVDNDWNNLSNWWLDDSFSTPAIALPSSIDSVIISGSITSNSGNAPTIVNLTTNAPSTIGIGNINLTVTGVATFNSSGGGNSYLANSTLTGKAIFNSGCENAGTVIGNVIFNQAYNRPQGTVNAASGGCSLLLHMNGTNESTSFTDSSANSLTITANGNAYLSTSESKFGGASAYFDGNSPSYLSISNESNFSFWTNPFTIELWVYMTGGGEYRGLVDLGSGYDADRLALTWYSDGSLRLDNYLGLLISNTPLPLNQWVHVAVSRDANRIGRMFFDGVIVAEAKVETSFTATAARVGMQFDGRQFGGYIDELRIINGKCEYTSNFTPQNSEFSNPTSSEFGCIFNSGSINQGLVTGDCLFKNTSYNDNGSTVTGNCIFNNTSYNNSSGTINGNCIFTDASSNIGFTTGICIFNDYSQNQNQVTGNCIFNNSSLNSGIIYGNCTFNNSSYHNGYITGDCIFNNSTHNDYIISGNCTFNDNSYSFFYNGLSSITGDCTFNDNSQNNCTITGYCYFNDSSTNGGIVNGNCEFKDYSSIIPGAAVNGGIDFYDNSYNGASITANCDFNDNSHNESSITGTCTFNGNSYHNNGSIILGDCTFNDNSINKSEISGSVSFYNNSSNRIDVYYDSYLYSDGSNSNMPGAINFYNTSNNWGAVYSNYTFNDDSFILDINGNGAANGNYYRSGEVAFTIPSTIYVRADGSDNTGDATLSSPLSTAQLAYNCAIETSGDSILDFGDGNFGGIVLSSDWPSRISLRGTGAGQSFLGGINGNGVDEVFDYGSNTTISLATSGKNISINSDKTINLGDIVNNGGNGNSGGFAGSVTFTNCIVSTINSNGGVGGQYGASTGNYYSGGNGGSITLTNCTVISDIYSIGGASTGDMGGNGGNVTLTNSDCGQIYNLGGVGDGGGNGGVVTLTNSTSNHIYNSGANNYSDHSSYSGIGGNGGVVSLINSTSGNINSIGGMGDYGYSQPFGGNGGSVSLLNSNSGDIVAYGGNSEYDVGGNGGTINIEDSSCGIINAVGGQSPWGGGSGGVVTLSGLTTIPNSIAAGSVVSTNLDKGRGIKGSNILGLN